MFGRFRSLLRAAEATTGPVATKVSLNFMVPTEAVVPLKSAVDMVVIPATSGLFGVMAGHVPTLAQLKPGVVSVHYATDDVVDYFVAGGFAVVRSDSSVDISAVEACKVSDLDAEAVRKGLATSSQEMTSAQSEIDRARAQIQYEVHEAMAAALNLPRA